MNIWSKDIFNTEPHKGWLPWGALAPILTLVFIVATMMLSGTYLLEPFGFVDANLAPTGAIGFVLFLVVSFGLILIIFAAWIHFVEKRSFASIGLNSAKGLQTFLKGHAVGVALMSIIVTTIWVLGGYEVGAIAPALSSPIDMLYIFLLLLGFALQSSVEELVFRGWLLSVLTRKFNLLAAIIINVVLFSFMHFSPANPWYSNINILVFAIFATVWVIQTGNIWGVMGWHSGWNWFTATGFEVPITGLDTDTSALIVQLTPSGNSLLTGANMGPEGSIICTVVLTLSTLYLLRRPTHKPV